MNWCAHEGIPKLLDENALLKTKITPANDHAQSPGSFQAALSRHKSKHRKIGSTAPVNGTR